MATIDLKMPIYEKILESRQAGETPGAVRKLPLEIAQPSQGLRMCREVVAFSSFT